MPAGSARLPPPAKTGPRKIWHSSTSPWAIAWPARFAPPIEISDRELSFSCLIAEASNSRSIRVLSLETV